MTEQATTSATEITESLGLTAYTQATLIVASLVVLSTIAIIKLFKPPNVNITPKPIQPNLSSNQNAINGQKPTTKQLHAHKKRGNPKPPGDEIPVTILYGTQTGTAEELAKRIGNELKKYTKFFPSIIDVEEYQYEKELKEAKFVVLVFATYGEGEPTDNAKDFYEWIRSEDRGQDLNLSGVQYTVFGLGNKTYEHYNETGRILDKRFSDLGAKSIFPRGEGDDDGNLEDDFCKWSLKLYPALKEHFGITEEKKDGFRLDFNLEVIENVPETKPYTDLENAKGKQPGRSEKKIHCIVKFKIELHFITPIVIVISITLKSILIILILLMKQGIM